MANTRLPDSTHKLNGTYRKDRHGSSESGGVEIAKGYPAEPEFIAGNVEALKIWISIREVMEPSSLYTEADKNNLARYCVLQAEFQDDPKEFAVGKLAQLRLLESDLYLTPQSRAKLGVKDPKGGANAFAELFGNA